MIDLQKTIGTLQLNNKLVILRTCGSEHQNTLLRGLTTAYHAVDCSLPSVRMQVEQDAEAFAGNLPLPVYLAHLHYVPALLPCLLRSGLPLGQILASCGQSCFLQQTVNTGEDGAAVFMDLPLAAADAVGQYTFLPTGQCLEQILQRENKRDVLTAIVQGSFGADRRQAAFQYIHQTLQHDIMEHTPVSDDIALYRLLCAAAGMSGSVVNYALLANSVGISAPTVKQWLQFLAGAGVIYFLQPVDDIAGKRLVKAPKLYFRDTAAAAYLLRLYDASALVPSLYFKNLYENYVVNILREGFLRQGIVPEWRFYRDSNNKEINLLIRWESTLYPVFISKDAVNVQKLQKIAVVLQPYAERLSLYLGVGCVITLQGESRQLAAGLWQVNAASL